MASLEDIAATPTAVDIRGKSIEVYGISAKGVASLLRRFPNLRALINGQQLEVDDMLALGGSVVGAVIAAGVGRPEDEAAEDIATKLPVGDQVDLLAVIKELTLPGGPGPLGQKLSLLLGITSESASA